MKRIVVLVVCAIVAGALPTAAQNLLSSDLDRIRSFAASEYNKLLYPEQAVGYSGDHITLQAIATTSLGSLKLFRAYTLPGSDLRPILIGYLRGHMYALGGTKEPDVLEAFNAIEEDTAQLDYQRLLWLTVMTDPNGAQGVLIPCHTNGFLVKPQVTITPDSEECIGMKRVDYRIDTASRVSIKVKSAIVGFYHRWDSWTLQIELNDKGKLLSWSIVRP